MAYAGLITETIAFTGHGGATGEAYYARPLGDGPYPGVVVIHHRPGWDEWCTEVTRKLAHHGISASPPTCISASVLEAPTTRRHARGLKATISDDQVIGDIAGAMAYLRRQTQSNGKVGVIGFCSGGRYSYLAACRFRTSTRWWIAGAAVSSSMIPRTSRRSARSPRSTCRNISARPSSESSATTTRTRAPLT